MNDIKLGKWHPGSEIPKKPGWYLRDYRNPPKQTDKQHELPPYSVDYFAEGFWYIADMHNKAIALNDAWFESLPWCKIKENE